MRCASTACAHDTVPQVSEYDSIARLYDPWSRSVVEDVPFYLEEARRSRGPVVELAVGTGRIAVPIASDGIRVIGVDSSPGMLEVAAERAKLAGAPVDLRLGDIRDPPIDEHVPLVICPFRSFLHLHTDADRRKTLRAVHKLLQPGGRFIFDVFAPSREDIVDTNDRWLEREPGIWERAVWNEDTHTLTLTVRNAAGELFAAPSVVVDDRKLRSSDRPSLDTFLISRGTRGVRISWQQPAGTNTVRLGYRLALLGTAYDDVVDVDVPLWEGDWPARVT